MRVLSPSGVELFSSGLIAGTPGTYNIPYLFTNGAVCFVAVRTGDAIEVGAEATQEVRLNLASIASYPVLASVGSLYDVAINGIGYCLFENFDDVSAWNDFQYDSLVKPLESPRLATGQTAFNEAVEQYSFVGTSDWSGGAGTRYHSEDSGPTFSDSERIDPFTQPGTLRLVNETTLRNSNTFASCRATPLGNDAYSQRGANTLRLVPAGGGAVTDFTVAAATTITDLTNDGANWYAAAGAAGIFRNTTAADPGAAWSAIAATVIAYEGQRICAALASAGSTPNRFTTLNSAGAEEVGGGRITFPTGWTITNFTSTNGYVYFGVRDTTNRGYVYKWQIGSANAPTVAVDLPVGVLPHSVLGEQGQVIVTARIGGSTTNAKGAIYRCPIDSSGNATPFLVTEFGDTSLNFGDTKLGAFGRFIYWGWTKMNASGTATGLACLDLSTGGWAKFFEAPGVTGAVTSIITWESPARIAFTVASSGLWSVSPTAFVSNGGFLNLSYVDGSSTLDKVFDSVELSFRPLATNEYVNAQYVTSDSDSSYLSPVPNLTLAGSKAMTIDLDYRSEILGIQLVLGSTTGASTPIMSLAQLRMHPASLADEIITLPIHCGDRVKLINGANDPSDGPGAGARRLAVLKALVGTRVRLQDVDWADTGQVQTFEVMQVRSRRWVANSTRLGRQTSHRVGVVTLRKRAV